MQTDPMEEWRRLTESYAGMCDEELEELAADANNLTETARMILRDEMRKRRLGEPGVASEATAFAVVRDWTPGAELPSLPETKQVSDSSREGAWKLPLCSCEGPEEAWQLSEALREAGIESWTARQPSYGADGVYATDYTAYSPLVGPERLQVLVAADQLEQAREVVARPIPPAIVALSKMQLDDFEPPKCPRCGAADPVLEGVTPTNSWLCEGCGNRWSEPGGGSGGG